MIEFVSSTLKRVRGPASLTFAFFTLAVVLVWFWGTAESLASNAPAWLLADHDHWALACMIDMVLGYIIWGVVYIVSMGLRDTAAILWQRWRERSSQ